MSKVKKMLPTNQIRASISDTSVNEESRTVDLTWTTGSKGLRHSWGGSYYEELSLKPEHVDLSRLNDGSHPLLAAHNDQSLDSVIGVVERAWLEGDKAGATVRFARDDISDRVFQKVKDKILRNVSVGYSVSEYTDVSADGDETPTYRATRWQPAELSIVPIGFDKDAKVRKDEVRENEVEIINRSKEPTTSEVPECTSSEHERSLQMTELEMKALAEKQAKEAKLAEKSRVKAIRSLVKAANIPEETADDLIESDSSVEEAQRTVEQIQRALEASKKTETIKGSTRVEVGTEDVEKKRDGIAESMLVRIDSQNFKPSEGNPFLGKSLLRNLESVITRRPTEGDVQYATRVMSSSDLPYILANSGEKAAQKKYDLAQVTWNRWAKSDTLRNFKTADRVRSGDFAALQERQENGEFVQGSFGEEREQVALKEWGVKMAFTRRMLINDDLSEISKVIAQGGAAAANLENQLVYSVLTSNPDMADGEDLFGNPHLNLGTPASLTDASIGEAVKLMKQQKSVDLRHYLNLAPRYLICGPTEEINARKYLAQISPTQSSQVNIYSGSLELIVDPNITTNDYFFAADPSLIDTVVLFRLEGEERPRIESRTDFDTESVIVKCAHSAVAKALDHRGLVKNANGS